MSKMMEVYSLYSFYAFICVHLLDERLCLIHSLPTVLQIGDTITKVDGRKVTMDDYERAVIGCGLPGSTVQFTVIKPQVRRVGCVKTCKSP